MKLDRAPTAPAASIARSPRVEFVLFPGMDDARLPWSVEATEVPEWFLATVSSYAPDGKYLAPLLWQRGIRDPERLASFLNPDCYRPSDPCAFGEEMERAVARLQQAIAANESVAIWGDFDADGITATSVLWEGLGALLGDRLRYTIPDRLRESHGLNTSGLERLAAAGVTLIVTCDTGSTNLNEIAAASTLGLDIIITDHHTLPPERPEVAAIVNPRYLAPDHPLYHLSGVAVAYKLLEALYARLPDAPAEVLDRVLDLVAIGLIADLVQLSGDCRYLAQRGIARLQQQNEERSRPGVAQLLSFCQGAGDRPTDISFGIGPRINAVSRIQGDASFCVELLTSRDEARCRELATEAELANNRRKGLQRQVATAVEEQLARLDLSTTNAIVLADPQWHAGVLGLVAGQIAREYSRPTVLLATDATGMARGSARSVNGIDLYELVRSQAALLTSFGGHPFAAGLSLPADNVPLFRDALQQQLRQRGDLPDPEITADLAVTVAELGRDLFRELRLLEPCGMANPVPRLLVRDCWFEDVKNINLRDRRGNPVRYIRTHFHLCDRTGRFRGIWWGHYARELPRAERCDALVELDYNAYSRDYEVRLLAVRPATALSSDLADPWLLDWRRDRPPSADIAATTLIAACPSSWGDLSRAARRARAGDRALALAYDEPLRPSPEETWEHLVGIAKFLSRTGVIARKDRLQDKLQVAAALDLGLDALSEIGFRVERTPDSVAISGQIERPAGSASKAFREAVAEEHFRRAFFWRAPVETIARALQ